MAIPKSKINLKLIALSVCVITGFIINSCRKEVKNVPQAALDPAIAQAKAWYEGTYSATNANSNQTAQGTVADKSFDFSQHVVPDWQHSVTYTRYDKNVIEMPLNAGLKITTALANNSSGDAVYKNEYSKSSFLLLNDGKNYEAYIMTIIADPAYLKNDLTKLARIKYNKRDSDFSGVVLYFTPKGGFVSSWFYKNGNIINAVLAANGTSNYPSVQNNNLQTQGLQTNLVSTVEVCTDWYQTVKVYDTSGNLVYSGDPTYLDTTCNTYTVDDGGGGGGGAAPGTGTGSSGGGGGPSTPPTVPCPPSTGSAASVSGPHLTTYQVQQPPAPIGGDGLPPPTANPNPCAVVTTQTPQKPTIDMLMKNPSSLTAAQKAQLQAILNQILKNCIGQATFNYFNQSSTKFNFSVNSSSSAPASYNPSTNSIVIQNPATVTPAALEEELFHAYQNAKVPGGTLQYAGKAGNANIEFEAKVMRDMSLNFDMLNGNSTGGITAIVDPNYSAWLQSITSNYTQYPTSFNSTQLSQYFSFMGEFIQQNPGYSTDIIKPGLNPTAMFSLINSSPCSN